MRIVKEQLVQKLDDLMVVFTTWLSFGTRLPFDDSFRIFDGWHQPWTVPYELRL